VRERAELVEKNHSQLSERQQCKLLGLPRSSLAYAPVAESAADRQIKRYLDELYLQDPCLGTRRLVTLLARERGWMVNRKRLQRLRREMGQEAIWCKPRTSLPNVSHRKFPYLLRGLTVERPDQVWCADITYVPMAQGHAYLCAVMDWHSRTVLGWAVANTMDGSLCQKALDAALENSGGRRPEIFNTDQGSQFTSEEWLQRLIGLGMRISMDGKGRWMDNVFIERLWRSVKHEDIYLREYRDIAALERGLGNWMARYNDWRPHAALGNRTPSEVYRDRHATSGSQPTARAVA
jgi:putative transposase